MQLDHGAHHLVAHNQNYQRKEYSNHDAPDSTIPIWVIGQGEADADGGENQRERGTFLAREMQLDTHEINNEAHTKDDETQGKD